MSQYESSVTHRKLVAGGAQIEWVESNGMPGDKCVDIVGYADGDVRVFTNGDPTQLERWTTREEARAILDAEGGAR